MYTYRWNDTLSRVLLLSNCDQTADISEFFGDESLGQERDERVSWSLVGIYRQGARAARAGDAGHRGKGATISRACPFLILSSPHTTID